MLGRSVVRAHFQEPTRGQAGARVLVIVAHPVLHKSRVNRALVHALEGIEGVTVHDLYEAAPEFAIDVAREQALLSSHDTIVLQHPFYWYSTPALLKEWQDHVLTFGWAYGAEGRALHGKRVLTAVTTGGPHTSYQEGGGAGITVRALLAPIAQTARLCGMSYLPPFVVHGTHRLDAGGIAAAAGRYRAVIQALVDGTLDPVADDFGALDVARSLRTYGDA